MVADDAASRDVWFGENGALAGARRGAILIESSTLTPDWARELGHKARSADFALYLMHKDARYGVALAEQLGAPHEMISGPDSLCARRGGGAGREGFRGGGGGMKRRRLNARRTSPDRAAPD
jgi:3-hydroxyisobutyrate dehydrogenase-like beta-hydroxyacid dehydrogenase